MRQIETAVSYDERKIAFFSSDEKKWINKMRKLAEQHPDECQITGHPEGNDGCINAKFPAKWLKVAVPRSVDMTEEQRQAAAERMRRMRDVNPEEIENDWLNEQMDDLEDDEEETEDDAENA